MQKTEQIYPITTRPLTCVVKHPIDPKSPHGSAEMTYPAYDEENTLNAWTYISAYPFLTHRVKPVAELRPVAPARVRRAGFAKGIITYIAPDFDAPLDDFADYQ